MSVLHRGGGSMSYIGKLLLCVSAGVFCVFLCVLCAQCVGGLCTRWCTSQVPVSYRSDFSCVVSYRPQKHARWGVLFLR